MAENSLGKRGRDVVVGISGASGAIYGQRLLEVLAEMGLTTHLVMTQPATVTIRQELELEPAAIRSLATHAYNPANLAAPIASGSFITSTVGMIVAPCSIKTLSAIAHSYTANLLTRAADVTLKEGRPLILVVRETPFASRASPADGAGGGEWRGDFPARAGLLPSPRDHRGDGRSHGRAHPGANGRVESPLSPVAGRRRRDL